MTDKQHRLYLREWSAAWAKHWCGSKAGEVLARPGRPPSPLREELMVIARQIAARLPDGKLSADVVRHACHVAALGLDVSSRRMTNKQLDLILAYFRRLAESGKELSGQIRADARDQEVARQTNASGDWSSSSGGKPPWRDAHPDADRKRVIWSLENIGYPEAAIAVIARDKFGVMEWRGLADRELYELLLTVKRAAARKADQVGASQAFTA